MVVVVVVVVVMVVVVMVMVMAVVGSINSDFALATVSRGPSFLKKCYAPGFTD
jgi:uncharacterized membrane protein